MSKPPESQRSAPATTRAVGRCRAADLSLTSILEGYAMGTVGHEITVKNTGTRPCALLGDTVVIVYRDATGKNAVLPATSTGTVPAGRILGRGQRAHTVVLTVNGYGGYQPSSPACAHPAVYRNLSVRLSGGGLVALKGLVLDVKCGDIHLLRWSLATGQP